MGTNSVTERGRLGFSVAIIFNIYANNATENGTSKFIINNVKPVHCMNMITQLWQYQSVYYRGEKEKKRKKKEEKKPSFLNFCQEN